jgi:hypothetical protein
LNDFIQHFSKNKMGLDKTRFASLYIQIWQKTSANLK